jgi:hypothetical protein
MKNNEPAFPSNNHPSTQAHEAVLGMSLRDWFAGQALVGIYSGKTWESIMLRDNPEALAYRIADAMLEERSRE